MVDTMEITKDYNGNDLTVKVEGRIDTVTSQVLDREFEEEYDKLSSLTLDCEKLEYISSAGLRILIQTEKELKGMGKTFTIININDTIKEILRMSGIDKLLNIQ